MTDDIIKDDIEHLSAADQLALALRIVRRQLSAKLEPEALADIIEAAEDALEQLANRAKNARKGKKVSANGAEAKA
ncbi:MAG: hypothetical protein ABW217_03900 [Polyangiaceae bacterium]